VHPACPPAPRPGLMRRLCAIFYDCVLLFGVLYGASFPLLIASGGEALPPGNPYYQAYLLAVIYLYFTVFWTRGGQTLGMKAWRLRLVNSDGNRPDWRQASVRFAGALLSWAFLGLGFFWILFDSQRRAWHDRLSETVLVRDPAA
jgi:uncharacterized RDD family membrane protein YckC